MAGVDNPAYEPNAKDQQSVSNGKNHHYPARLTVSSPSSLTVPQLTVTGTNGNAGDIVLEEDLVKVTDFDDVLPHVGEFGVYQVALFFLTAPFCFFLAFAYFSQVFITLVPDHWCRVPELINNNQSAGLTLQEM